MKYNIKTINYFKLTGKEILFLLFLWVLIYIEPTTIGAFKISQLWKTVVVIGLLLYSVKRPLPWFVLFGILFSLKYLLYTHMPYGYLRAIQDAFESLIFPLFLAYFYFKYRHHPNSTEQLMHISIVMSLFIIFSTIPFFFGVKSLHPAMELEAYGIEGTALKGLFYSIAGSSKLFTIATIVLINSSAWFANRFYNRLIWLSAVLMGTYFVYASWTRTGWFLFFIAFVISLFYGANIKQIMVATIVSVILVMSVAWVYETNQAFRWRLTGGAKYRQNTVLTVEQLSKARIPFIKVAINNLKSEGVGGQLLGYGTQRGLDLFKQRTGMAISSHNRTFEILESSGIVALFLYFMFVYKLFSPVIHNFKHASFEVRRLAFVSIFLFCGFYLSSHGTPFWGEIIFAPIFISILINYKRFRANKMKVLEIDNGKNSLYRGDRY